MNTPRTRILAELLAFVALGAAAVAGVLVVSPAWVAVGGLVLAWRCLRHFGRAHRPGSAAAQDARAFAAEPAVAALAREREARTAERRRAAAEGLGLGLLVFVCACLAVRGTWLSAVQGLESFGDPRAWSEHWADAEWRALVIGLSPAALVAVAVGLGTYRLRRRMGAAQREVHESERRFRALVETADVVVWEFDAVENRFTYVSPQAERWGYPLSDWYRPNFWAEHVHPEDRDAAVRFCVEQTRAGKNHHFQYRMVKADGGVIWVDDVVSVEHHGHGAVLRGVLVDITQTRATEERLLVGAQLQAVTHQALEEAQSLGRLGSWTYDAEGGQMHWSRHLHALMGRDEAQGAPDFATMLADYDAASAELFEAAVRQAALHGTAFDLVLHAVGAPDGLRFVRAQGRARRDERGKIVALYGTVMDVTDTVEREDALRAARQEADAASRAKSEFLANMSHEIRTPLTAILGYADLLRDDREWAAVPERRRKAVETIRQAGEHLLSVINDILDISKIEADRMRIAPVDSGLIEMIVEVETLMRPRAEEKGVGLSSRLETALPERLIVDPTRLRQILVNVVGNAVKFTEKGAVELCARRVDRDGRPRLQIDVRDSGPGLTEAQARQLFAAFGQADATTTRRHGGTGLGLRISRRLARLMDGDVELLSSSPGQGSCFRIDLPLVAFAHTEWVTEVPRADARSFDLPGAPVVRLSARILLAEDGLVNQRLIAHHLRRAGAVVDVVENGQLALDRLYAEDVEPYDLLVTDMQMPERDGYSLARALRDRGSWIPIVALTAHAMATDRQKCLDAGCDDYATKPIDAAELLLCCERWIAIGRSRKETRRAA